MERSRSIKETLLGYPVLVILVALAGLVFFLLFNHAYGFHRDELAFVDNARNLDWGYVEYPPLAPWIARVSLALFGPSLAGLRFFAALAASLVILLTGFTAYELGGSPPAQAIAALAAATAPVVLFSASFFSYQTFDYLWWVLASYLMLRLLKSGNPRWWLALGAVIGLGMLTKFTMAYLAAGIAAGVLLTPARRFLKSPWLWAGAALSLLIFLPNLAWQFQHNFATLEFLGSIHARDVEIGRANDFLLNQVLLNNNPLFFWLSLVGLWYFFFAPQGRPYRALGWMFAAPFVLFLASRGRFYYIAPAYPQLLAAGVCWLLRPPAGAPIRGYAWRPWLLGGGLAVSGLLLAALVLPQGAVNSAWWNASVAINSELKEEIGWPELAGTVAEIYQALPAEERAQAGILAGNYGEAGALNLYGPALGLPRAISGANSYWLRGYGDPPPQVLVVVGIDRAGVERIFKSCTLAGQVTNAYGVLNEETTRHPDIFVCREMRLPWPEFWQEFHYSG